MPNVAEPLIDRWNKYVHRDATGCWLWTGHLDGRGYGVIRIGSRTDGTRRLARAHRVSYELLRGPIPETLQIDHLCRVRACVNPDHLEPVSNRTNAERAAAAATRCRNGHDWSAANTLMEKTRTGLVRRCRLCERDQARRYNASVPVEVKRERWRRAWRQKQERAKL